MAQNTGMRVQIGRNITINTVFLQDRIIGPDSKDMSDKESVNIQDPSQALDLNN